MIVFNLREIPKLWPRLYDHMKLNHRTELVSSPQVTKVLQEHFNIKVTIIPHSKFGTVSMAEKDYIWLLLKWL